MKKKAKIPVALIFTVNVVLRRSAFIWINNKQIADSAIDSNVVLQKFTQLVATLH